MTDTIMALEIDTTHLRSVSTDDAGSPRHKAELRGSNATLRTNYLDDGYWLELASARGVRLPYTTTPCTTGGMEKWLRRVGLSVEWYRDWTGYDKLTEWIVRNPGFSLRAFVGQALEEGLPSAGVTKEAHEWEPITT